MRTPSLRASTQIVQFVFPLVVNGGLSEAARGFDDDAGAVSLGIEESGAKRSGAEQIATIR